MKRYLLLYLFALTGLSGCVGGPRLLNFPFDPGGRSLNSPASELSPRTTGRYVVFVSDRRGSEDVYLFDTLTRSLVELPGLNAFDAIASHPAVSANGRYIVCAVSRQGRVAIVLYDRETRQARTLTNNLPAEVRNPTINADGTRIAFEATVNGQWDIFIYNQNGERINIP